MFRTIIGKIIILLSIAFLMPGHLYADNSDVSERFKRFKETVRQQKTPAKTGLRKAAKRSAAPAYRTDEIDVRLRPNGNTPLQIRVKNTARKALPKTEDENTAREFLRSTRHILGIAQPDQELALEKKQEDDTGQRHLRFSQRFQNIPVWPAQLNVHLSTYGQAEMLNGAFIRTPRKMVTTPVISSEEAALLARKRVSGSDNASLKTPELIIYAPSDKASRLSWKTVVDISKAEQWLVVIDALSGDVLTAYNQIPNDRVTGSGTDIFGISRPLSIWEKNGQYYMADTSKPMYNAASSSPPSADSTYGAIVILDMQNNSPDGNPQYVTSSNPRAGWYKDAVSAAFCLSETYNYYQERHNRNSIDDKGSTIFGVIRVGNDYDNAFWNSETQMMYFGDAEAFAGALDVVAHELTHGITSYTANLVYQDQPGALNEAFSDIFGEAVEARTSGRADWLMGTTLPDQIRNMSNPSSMQIGSTKRYYPSKMSQFYGENDSLLDKLQGRDNGGVHINSTIIGHAFYLLAEGMNGALGIQTAEKIFYRALSYHLTSNSQFIDARLACVASAEELFGKGSTQALRTAAAFDAVEIYDGTGTSTQPTSIPAASGDDSALFVYYDAKSKGYFLGRRETGDPTQGIQLSAYDAALSRPSVSGDGNLAVFVNTSNDVCFIRTDGSAKESCMGWNDVSSVAMSRDGNLFGFVMLNSQGQRSNKLTIFNLRNNLPAGDSEQVYTMVAPTYDGITTNTILMGDTMSFSVNNSYVFYDAYNVIKLADGSQFGAWSIYGIDLTTKQTIVVVPPIRGYDIGNPSFGQTSDDFVAFDVYDPLTRTSVIYAMNLINGDRQAIAKTGGDWGTPCYTGDDKAIVYSSGTSLWRQSVSGDHITPSGSPALYLENADYGTIYRRAKSVIVPTPTPQPTPPAEDSSGGGCFIDAASRILNR
jgi:Zn-dependent metalloprotease